MISIPHPTQEFLLRNGKVDVVWYRFLMQMTAALNTVVTVISNTTDEQGFNPFSLASDAEMLALEPRPPERFCCDETEAPMTPGLVAGLVDSILESYGLIGGTPGTGGGESSLEVSLTADTTIIAIPEGPFSVTANTTLVAPPVFG